MRLGTSRIGASERRFDVFLAAIRQINPPPQIDTLGNLKLIGGDKPDHHGHPLHPVSIPRVAFDLVPG